MPQEESPTVVNIEGEDTAQPPQNPPGTIEDISIIDAQQPANTATTSNTTKITTDATDVVLENFPSSPVDCDGRVQRVISNPPPRLMTFNNPPELRSQEQLLKDFGEMSEVIEKRGALYALVRGSGNAAYMSYPIVLLTAFICGVIATVPWNYWLSDAPFMSRAWAHFALFTPLWITFGFVAIIIAFIQYPEMTRNKPYMFFEGELKNYLMILYKGLGFLSFQLMPFEICRFFWRRLKKARNQPRKNHKCLSPNTWMHWWTWIGISIISVFNILSRGFGVGDLIYYAGEVFVCIPFIGIIIWSNVLYHKDHRDWSGGIAIAVPATQLVISTMAVLLPTLVNSSFGGNSTFMALIRLYLFYLVYGLLITINSWFIERMMQPFDYPQYEYIYQCFLDLYTAICFVSLDSTFKFWVVLVVQSVFAQLRFAGLFSYFVFKAKNWISKHIFRLTPVYTFEELSKRHMYLNLCYMQDCFSDVTTCIVTPMMVLIDLKLPWGVRTISTNLTNNGMLYTFLWRYAVILCFRSICWIGAILSQSIQFIYLAEGKQGITPHNIVKECKCMALAFRLHLWRNLPIITTYTAFLYLYASFDAATTSSSSFSSSSANTN